MYFLIICLVAIVGNSEKVLYSGAFGHLTYSEDDEETSLETLFDLASVSKVFATTSAVALLYERGKLLLRMLCCYESHSIIYISLVIVFLSSFYFFLCR